MAWFEAGSGGSGSDDVTGTKNKALAGYTFITSDSDDEPVEGTFQLSSGSATANGTYTAPANSAYSSFSVAIPVYTWS